MKASNLLLTGAALGAACLLVLPREGHGYTTSAGRST
jgi:hypothetical protein